MTTKMKTIFLLTYLFFAIATATADELPKLMLPEGVGVNIHFTRGRERDLDMIEAAGFKFIRMDLTWDSIEREKGVYDWSAYDELTKNLERRGIRPYYILDYSNPLYEKTVVPNNQIYGYEKKDVLSPQHPESVSAFARWAAAAAKHFLGHHVVWEIWNEPNISFWKPAPDVNQYAALAIETAKALRASDPQATILAPAMAGLPWPFLESFFKSGALEYLDGVSVHPYRAPSQPPETAAKDFQRLRELIIRYTPLGRKPVAIISGEWGYATDVKGVSLETQAQFAVRQQIANLMSGVPISIWYDWKNDGSDSKNKEHNFGTVSMDLAPKPAYVAIQTLTRELAGFTIRNRLQTEDSNDIVLVLTNNAGGTKLAAWTLGESHTINLPLLAAAVKEISVVDGGGQVSAGEIKDGSVTLSISGAPRYVNLGRAKLQ